MDAALVSDLRRNAVLPVSFIGIAILNTLQSRFVISRNDLIMNTKYYIVVIIKYKLTVDVGKSSG